MRGNIQDNLPHSSDLSEGTFAGAAGFPAAVGGFTLSALNWFQLTSPVIKMSDLAQK